MQPINFLLGVQLGRARKFYANLFIRSQLEVTAALHKHLKNYFSVKGKRQTGSHNIARGHVDIFITSTLK